MDHKNPLSAYQKFVIFLLAFTQFTVVLDFMVMNPLGDILMKSLDISTDQFGYAVAAYAFSAGFSGLLTAGFADRFDRKKLLLFFYVGFIIGTLFCGLAHTYQALIAARIVTGIFGGVIGSISMAIISDLFAIEQRGRVMGFMQMGFGASQVLGIPISLYLANHWSWESPFLLIVGLSSVVWLLALLRMQPVTAHLALQHDHHPLEHLRNTLLKRRYRIGFTATALLSVGGFMMMPFGSAFAINNLRITQDQLTLLFMISGLGTLAIMPIVGRLSDKIDKYRLFLMGSIWAAALVVIYTNLSATPLWMVIALNILMMAGIMGRIVPANALITAIPEMRDRGAFMSINASLQLIAGGIAAAVGGQIVVQKDKFAPIEHYDTLGYVIVGITVIAAIMMYRVNKMVRRQQEEAALHKELSVVPEEETVAGGLASEL